MAKYSPYESPITTILIGDKTFFVHEYCLRKYFPWELDFRWNPSITLTDVDEDIGHTVVHFIYTGTYETLTTASESRIIHLAREYKRSIQAYHAARAHKLHDLEVLAKWHIENLGESVSIFDMLQAVRTVFSKLPDDEVWLHSHINMKLRSALELEETVFMRDEFYREFGEDPVFDKAVMRMVVNIFSSRILAMRCTIEHQRSNTESSAEETPDGEHPVDVPPTEEYLAGNLSAGRASRRGRISR